MPTLSEEISFVTKPDQIEQALKRQNSQLQGENLMSEIHFVDIPNIVKTYPEIKKSPEYPAFEKWSLGKKKDIENRVEGQIKNLELIIKKAAVMGAVAPTAGGSKKRKSRRKSKTGSRKKRSRRGSRRSTRRRSRRTTRRRSRR